jgi:hypothetical protein
MRRTFNRRFAKRQAPSRPARKTRPWAPWVRAEAVSIVHAALIAAGDAKAEPEQPSPPRRWERRI